MACGRRAGEFQRSSDFVRDAAMDAAGPRMVPSGDRIRSHDRRRSSEAHHRASEDRGDSRDLGGSREARRRSSERRCDTLIQVELQKGFVRFCEA